MTLNGLELYVSQITNMLMYFFSPQSSAGKVTQMRELFYIANVLFIPRKKETGKFNINPKEIWGTLYYRVFTCQLSD